MLAAPITTFRRSVFRPILPSFSKLSKEMATEDSSCRVLSIQSHVVSGYVGNKAAVFPMQVLGFDVDFINSVQFSNHTGYPNKLKGTVLSGTELLALSTGLSDNYLLDYDYLLTGYIGSETFLNSVVEILDTIQKANPKLKYVCDPVLGDHQKYYVPVALVDIFKAKLIPRAYMITPNQFEAELLTGMKIQCEEDAVKALIQLHKLGPQVVVLTSAEFSSSATPAGTSLHCYILYPDSACTTDTGIINGEDSMMVTKIEVNKVAGNYTGTGDAMAALLLSWTHLLLQQQQLQQSGQQLGCHISDRTGDTGDSSTDGASSSDGSSIGPSSCVGGGGAGSGDVGGDEKEMVGSNPFSGALCNALSTVKAMIERSSERLRQHNAQLRTSASSTLSDPTSTSSSEGEAEGSRQHCATVRARELQVVQSKRDIEVPPVQKLDCISHSTWRVNTAQYAD